MTTHVTNAMSRLRDARDASFGRLTGTNDQNLRLLLRVLSEPDKEQSMMKFLDVIREVFNHNYSDFYRFAIELACGHTVERRLGALASYLNQNKMTAEHFKPSPATQGTLVALYLQGKTTEEKAVNRNFLSNVGFTSQFILENFDENVIRKMLEEAAFTGQLRGPLVNGYMKRFGQAPSRGELIVSFLKAKPTLYRQVNLRKYSAETQRQIIAKAPTFISHVSAQELFDMFSLTAPQWLRLLKSIHRPIHYFPPGFFELLNKKSMLAKLKGGAGNKRIVEIPPHHMERKER